ncbi:hypothetical protein GALMADRAFT_1115987 [Galerina marginata CBS 339.88]|uniref:Uncharacterized protein n=1 Tax=Galerina marginata (strain CBS 339.88) TaxID=685588 RepID=A0A067TCM3_GALM3|nr:hypothetical protein GALMADRAFT_1115987 [Galerina marginata CBS 339.88]
MEYLMAWEFEFKTELCDKSGGPALTLRLKVLTTKLLLPEFLGHTTPANILIEVFMFPPNHLQPNDLL